MGSRRNNVDKNASFSLPNFPAIFIEALRLGIVFVWAVLFLFGHTLGILFALYLSFTPLFSLLVIYLVWMYCFDMAISRKGGRRSLAFRGLKTWQYFRDYFPARLVRTRRLDVKKNYIFGYHPHGIMCAGAWLNFGTEATGFSKLFPGITPHLLTLKVMFRFPFLRDFVMAGGLCDVSKESIEHILTRQGSGNAVVIAVGGAAESLDAHPGSYTLTLKNRKGFAKIALRTGSSLVPVFSFGENSLFDQVSNPRGSWLRALQTKFMKTLSYAPPLFFGRGIISRIIGFLPHKKPIRTVVGAPIHVKKAIYNPNPQQISRLHKKYVQGLIALFEEQKHRYGVPKYVKLTIV